MAQQPDRWLALNCPTAMDSYVRRVGGGGEVQAQGR